MGLREQHTERERQWREFHAQDSGDSPAEREPSAVLADLSFLLRFVPPEEMLKDPDPEKVGIGKMRAALAAIARRGE